MNAMAAPASPLSAGSVAQLTISLLAIVALIFAASWALKRLKMAGPRGRGELGVIDQIVLGPRERVVLLRAGDSQVLIGIAAGGMVGLQPLAAPLVARATEAGDGRAAFAERLRAFMKPPGDA